MLFTKTFSKVLLSTLFVSSAFGGFTQVKRSEDETGLLARGLAAIDLGPDPGFKQYKKYFQTYCQKPFPKKGSKRDEIEQRGLDGRALPAGYQNIPVAQLTNMRGWMYTLDTSLSKDPSYRNDPYMKAEAEGLEEVYRSVRSGLETLVGSAHNVFRETHSFQHVGEMSVSPNGAVSFSTA
ncbi:hypothetical protein B0O99DRAFT_589554 [Bisporella sp. PMI_857]|nr:hypothetical protein B0O99DRAFT_589554 [Bisporella sp. PMI_857]